MTNFRFLLSTILLAGLMLSACAPESHTDDHGDDHHDEHAHDEHNHSAEASVLNLPELSSTELNGRPLNVVTTTTIIGDVVDNIGQDKIELIVLLSNNQDPHSYEATPGDLVALENADIIFINGWDLEEQLAETIEENFVKKTIEISAGIEPLETDKGSADPHVWLSIHSVEQWANNVEHVLRNLDPSNEESFETNLETYLAELGQLETEVESLLADIPADNRKLVTNHDAFGYFAAEYEFEIIGTVIPAASTNAAPSASDLADLIQAMQESGVCTIFAETTQNTSIAETVTAELDHCSAVDVFELYTGSLGTDTATTYIDMMRVNTETIAAGLQ